MKITETTRQLAERMEYIFSHLSSKVDRAVAEEAIQAEFNGYEDALASHAKLVRKIDVIINADRAAQQASLCDLVGQIKELVLIRDKYVDAVEEGRVLPKLPDGWRVFHLLEHFQRNSWECSLRGNDSLSDAHGTGKTAARAIEAAIKATGE